MRVRFLSLVMPSQRLSASVMTMACEMRWPWCSEKLRASKAAVLGAVARGMLGGHARELPEEAGGVWSQPAEPPKTSAMMSG